MFLQIFSFKKMPFFDEAINRGDILVDEIDIQHARNAEKARHSENARLSPIILNYFGRVQQENNLVDRGKSYFFSKFKNIYTVFVFFNTLKQSL